MANRRWTDSMLRAGLGLKRTARTSAAISVPTPPTPAPPDTTAPVITGLAFSGGNATYSISEAARVYFLFSTSATPIGQAAFAAAYAEAPASDNYAAAAGANMRSISTTYLTPGSWYLHAIGQDGSGNRTPVSSVSALYNVAVPVTPLVVLALGQSNMRTSIQSTGGVQTPDAQVFFWNQNSLDNSAMVAGTQFLTAAFGTPPLNIGSSGAWCNSIAFNHAKARHIATGRPVYVIQIAAGSHHIESFIKSATRTANGWPIVGANQDLTAFMYPGIANALALVPGGRTTVDEVIWAQGEANQTDAPSVYAAKFVAANTGLSTAGLINLSTTPIAISKLLDSAGNPQRDQHYNACVLAQASMPTLRIVDSAGSPPAVTDDVHYTGAGLVTMGQRFAAAIAAAPVLGDITPPVITELAFADGNASARMNEAGTVYYLFSASATPIAQSAFAAAMSSALVSGSFAAIVGENIASVNPAALTAGTWYFHTIGQDAAGNRTAVSVVSTAYGVAGAGPVVVASSKVTTSNFPTGTIAKPTGTLDGHMMVLIVGVKANATPVTPTGWTLIGSDIANGSNNTGLFAYKRVASSEPANYTLDMGGYFTWSAVITSYSNCTSVGALSSAHGFPIQNLTGPTITATGNSVIETIGAFDQDTITAPSGTTLDQQTTSAAGYIGLTVVHEGPVLAGTTTARTFNGSAANSSAVVGILEIKV